MVYSADYMDKYVQVIDTRSNAIIASGRVIGSKNNVENNGISFDNCWFFRESNNLAYNIVDYCETKLCVNPEKENLKWEWLTENFNPDTDVLRDNGLNELDPEIEPYILRLNKISNTIKTVTSCCGHNKEPWYIEFEFSEFWDLSKFINTVETFEGKLQITNSFSASTLIKRKYIHLILTPRIEDFEFVLLDKFCRKLTLVVRYKEC